MSSTFSEVVAFKLHLIFAKKNISLNFLLVLTCNVVQKEIILTNGYTTILNEGMQLQT